MTKLIIAMILTILMAGSNAWALEDTPENRAKEAKRYMAARPLKDMIMQVNTRISGQLPAEKRSRFDDINYMLVNHFDFSAVERAVRDAYVSMMTADELKAAADFYSSPAGRSFNKKFGAVVAEIMPTVQAEIIKAYSRAMTTEHDKE